MAESIVAERIAAGTPAYQRTRLALFLAGYATFSPLYCVQPLLPDLARQYELSAGAATMAMSASTAMLAVAIMAAAAFSHSLGRRGLMFASMAMGALLTVAAAAAPSWGAFLVARALGGFAFGGVPAVAMAYLAEEMAPSDLGKAMGSYVGGTAFGGMTGRLIVGHVAELMPWSAALAVVGAVNLIAAILFLLLLPRSRHFQRGGAIPIGRHLAIWIGHLRDRRLQRFYVQAFLATSVLVTIYNYAAFHLAAPPLRLGASAISLIFLCYALGIPAAGRAGALADRIGARRVIAGSQACMIAGLALALLPALAAQVAGIALITIGFFAAHSVASGAVARLGGATRGHASSLYLLFYYLGSSLVSVALGGVWQRGGWPGVVTACLGLATLALLLSWAARRADQ